MSEAEGQISELEENMVEIISEEQNTVKRMKRTSFLGVSSKRSCRSS